MEVCVCAHVCLRDEIELAVGREAGCPVVGRLGVKRDLVLSARSDLVRIDANKERSERTGRFRCA